ncbi:hypothetical protein GCM10010919_02900 [Alishewanella longhuensis]|uniref:Phage holin family protein n=1 Tax=Alishewanella longhuensis TaxID=1091037 RepID=A0ABQ3KVE0_9ALTE|nr:hypothetical protein [Alishewanella longhuensis]GHG59929.1 hypothetical protein GCM10010919_02900 [Alishewanella longhuensis]
MIKETSSAAGQAAEAADEPSVGDSVQALWQQLAALAVEQLQLFTLEGERVALSMVAVLMLGLLSSLLLLTLWFCGQALLVLLMLQTGINATYAILSLILVNLCGLGLVRWRLRYYSRLLRFPATLKSLQANNDEVAE